MSFELSYGDPLRTLLALCAEASCHSPIGITERSWQKSEPKTLGPEGLGPVSRVLRISIRG